MAKRRRFTARLEEAGRGGHVVAITDDVAASLGLKQHTRVKGTIAGTPYRSSTARYGGGIYLGVHKATVEKAGVRIGDRIETVIELDDAPRPVEIPPELGNALRTNERAKRAWEALPPSRQRAGSVRRGGEETRDSRPSSREDDRCAHR